MNTTQIRVICTDQQFVDGVKVSTHPSREIAVIRWNGTDHELLAVLLADPEVVPEEALALVEWEQTDALAKRSARRGGSVDLADPHERGFVDERGALWRFQCPTCRRDVPMRDSRLRRLVEGLLADGRTSVDLSHLR